MKIVAGINCGSSSLKVRLYEIEGSSKEDLAQKETGYFLAERVNESLNNEPNITFSKDKKEYKLRQEIKDHESAFQLFLNLAQEHGSIQDTSDIKIAGHRVVHGGRDIIKPEEVTEKTLELIQKNAVYAELHNPANKKGIEAAIKLLSGLEYQVVFCDTAFHSTIPPKARLYFLPWRYYEGGIQVYGFHGMSHEDASRRGPKLIGKKAEEVRQMTFHLGNGSSLASELYGICQDTTMGHTPLDGVPMGTRIGAFDAALIKEIEKREGIGSPGDIVKFLNKECGFKGVTGYNDMRDVIEKAAEGDKAAVLAREAYAYRIAKLAHSFLASLQGLDLIAWTGGIGENDAPTRTRVGDYFKWMGLELNPEANMLSKSIITTPNSKVQSVIVHADEERCYARDAYLFKYGGK